MSFEKLQCKRGRCGTSGWLDRREMRPPRRLPTGRQAAATNVKGRTARLLPRVKMDGAELGFYSGDGYRNQGDYAQHRQAEVDVYVGEQPALGDHIILKKLQCSQRGVAAGAAVAVNQICILRQSGA